MTTTPLQDRPRRLSAADLVQRAEEVLGLTEDAWRALRKKTRSTIAYACLEKKGQGEKAARARARGYRAAGRRATAYRCPFSPPDHHWHVGHVPSMQAITRLQEAIRDLHGNLPGDHPNPG